MNNNKFNEREAIQFEMQELKELSRIDTNYYWEMRIHRNKRYAELQDRLREIDEIEHKRTIETPKPIETLPIPKNLDISPIDLEVDRITETPKENKNAIVPMKKLAHEIELFLKEHGESNTKTIQTYIEQKFSVKYVNFTSTLRKVCSTSMRIKVDKNNPRKHKYYYY